VHCAFTSNWREEAQQVADLVASRYVTGMQRTIGILVRYRRQAIEIAAALRERKLPFQAIELETLESQPVVRDLTALARALLHLGDRAAWLAVLRSPFCGLTLADLSALTRDDEQSTCWELLNRHARLESLSTDGMRRARALIAVMGWALDSVRREPLRACVERTWLSLGGPATLREPRALEDAHAFLKRLEELSVRNALESGPAFEIGFADLYARPDPTRAPDQVMTFKAKGLEFDIVVIPRRGMVRARQTSHCCAGWRFRVPSASPGCSSRPSAKKALRKTPCSNTSSAGNGNENLSSARAFFTSL
jgi:ATP-dependent exoDNAse (exonuclease V) beta subunit